MKIKVVEVERGLHTCQYGDDCRTDARWRVNGKYLCGNHFKVLGYDKVYAEQLASQRIPSFTTDVPNGARNDL